MRSGRIKNVIFTILILVSIVVKGQKNDLDTKIRAVEASILEDQIQNADSLLKKTIEKVRANKATEQLSKLVYWQGKVELNLNKDKSFPKALALTQYIAKNTQDPYTLYRLQIDLSKLYNENGNLTKSIESASLAKTQAIKAKNEDALANSYYYLGEYGLRSGNINSFFDYIKKGHQIVKGNPDKEFKIAPRILNYMGAIKYFTSEPDSALYYYQSALDKVGIMENNPENRLYFPAAIKANMVLLKQSQNEFDEALLLAEECILLNKRFLQSSKKHPLRFRSQRNLSLAYRNLVSLYEQIGDYDKSYQIALIAYEHGKLNFEPQLLEYFSAVTLLAETKVSKKDFDGAIRILKEAKKSLDTMDGDTPLLQANYYTILGRAFYGKKDFKKAQNAYELGNKFHVLAQNEDFSSDRIFALVNLAMCYAQLGKSDKAYLLLDNTYAYQLQNSGSDRLLDVLLIAKARASDLSHDHPNVLNTTNKFLAKNSKDSINRASYAFRAEAITLNVKAKYHLDKEKKLEFLKTLDSELSDAINILEKRKALIGPKESINVLIAENAEVFDFAKKINLDLYYKTNKDTYLEKTIGLHESSIYNRIRTRLNLTNTISFINLPKKIKNREESLRLKLKGSVNDITAFMEASTTWSRFLDSIRVQYPEYYKMRYATLTESIDHLKDNIPKNTTLVRYFFVNDELYTYIADNNQEQLIALTDRIDVGEIKSFNKFSDKIEDISDSSYSLYQQLWKPIETHINTKRIIIFPDRELFNLSFELLTPQKINSFKDFADKSLLAKHDISYNYSLLLMDKNRKPLEFEKDFVAYAPEFDSSMKENYQLAIMDSIDLDKTYLTLLPQPFSSDLVKKYSKKFKGDSFLNEKASKQLFTKNAGEHKIIHIGSHAESNNVSPELSRLIFAKNVSDSTKINDNYLYTYEIYNQNLSSNLAILTACETGKPTYQPGEGMISLAHAFNYAGSESILTSLWQIDEQSSTEIISYFYEYLSEGKRKDEALRLAKLDYLKNAEGRTLHPQYWAGLVLMGDTAPIELSSQSNWLSYIITALLLIILIYFFLKKKRPSKHEGRS